MKNNEKSYTILIVEDEFKMQKALSDKIKRVGWQFALAGNGEEGLRMAESVKPDLILLDVIMPVMDGITMLKKLRKTSKVPVIILTNLYDEEKIFESMKMGNYDYLVKSNYSLDDIVKRIKKALK